jgi:hypothetical protein
MLSNIFFFNLCAVILYAGYPVDISYLVSDFKYSREYGVKICEVQQGSLSALTGDLYISRGDGSISPKIAQFFALLPMKKWTVGLLYSPLKRSLNEWGSHPSLNTLLKDPLFLQSAAELPANPFSLDSYAALLYAGSDAARNFSFYSHAYPGVLLIDRANLPYWKDKYKMNALFDSSDELKQYKADWRLYPKKYNPFLSARIQEEMPSHLYVIKPRSECLAGGVIVIASEDLDPLLQMILEPTPSLKNHPDKKYAYWSSNRDDTFLIEKYYPSDDLTHFGAYHYDATLRLAFILQCNQGKTTYHCLGGFWKLPPKALEEEGTLNEKRISLCEPPFYAPIDPGLFQEANAQMEKAMLLLYEIMLNNSSEIEL